MSWERLMSDAGKGAAMWKEIAEYQRLPLVELFGSDPARVSRFTVEESGLLFDFSKTHRSEDHTSALQSLMRISSAVFCLKTKNNSKHEPRLHTNYDNLN